MDKEVMELFGLLGNKIEYPPYNNIFREVKSIYINGKKLMKRYTAYVSSIIDHDRKNKSPQLSFYIRDDWTDKTKTADMRILNIYSSIDGSEIHIHTPEYPVGDEFFYGTEKELKAKREEKLSRSIGSLGSYTKMRNAKLTE